MSTHAERLLVFDSLVRPYMEARRSFRSAQHELSIWGGLLAQSGREEEVPDFTRGSGDVKCERCDLEIFSHPTDPRLGPGFHVRCDGQRIKT